MARSDTEYSDSNSDEDFNLAERRVTCTVCRQSIAASKVNRHWANLHRNTGLLPPDSMIQLLQRLHERNSDDAPYERGIPQNLNQLFYQEPGGDSFAGDYNDEQDMASADEEFENAGNLIRFRSC